MRTTLDIDDDLLTEARQRAKEEATTLTALIERALADLLTRQRSPERFELDIPTKKGRYIGDVSLSDRDALCEKMEADE